MFPIIRGTSITLHRRENRGQSQRLRFYGERGINVISPSAQNRQPQASRLSSYRYEHITLTELVKSLNTWQDPEVDANEFEAKERIMNCFQGVSNQLDLSCLDLSTLPDAIAKMHHLEFLNISNNRFSELPLILAELPHLKFLNVSYNILKDIPAAIKRLKNLEVLNAACNQLRKVSTELARLPMIQTVILSHNRILNLPENFDRIHDLEFDDQVALASFSNFSFKFATEWESTFQHEAGASCFEIWLARYEQIINLPEAAQYSENFAARMSMLLDAMIDNPDLRILCYEYAQNVIATCHDGILFSLFEMEIKVVEEKLIGGELTDEEIRKEMERAFNFYRLQELAMIHCERQFQSRSENGDVSLDEESQADALETALFFYISPANTLEMPLAGNRLRFMRYPQFSNANDDDVRQAVEKIQAEKDQLGQEFLIEFVSDKDFWINYLKIRYPDLIAEHTQIFMEQLNELEDRQDQLNEYHYLQQMNTLVNEKNSSEKLLYRQLTKNIVLNESCSD